MSCSSRRKRQAPARCCLRYLTNCFVIIPFKVGLAHLVRDCWVLVWYFQTSGTLSAALIITSTVPTFSAAGTASCWGAPGSSSASSLISREIAVFRHGHNGNSRDADPGEGRHLASCRRTVHLEEEGVMFGANARAQAPQPSSSSKIKRIALARPQSFLQGSEIG